MNKILIKTTMVLFLFIVLTLNGCTRQEKKIEVTVIANFGPANRPEIEQKITVAERSTVFEALRTAFPVTTSGR